MAGLLERIRRGEVLVCDGAMGTELIARGLKAGECPEEWCVSRLADVRDIATAYASAGADILETNSFGGNAIKLAAFRLSARAAELNHAAASIAKAAIKENGYVAGSVGPTGVFAKGEGGKTEPAEFYEAFRDQVVALAAGGADAICAETMWSATEATQAIRAAKENTGLPVICTFTFSKGPRGYRTAVGLTPEKAAEAAMNAGADVVGANCGNGVEQMIEVTTLIRSAHPNALIMIQANAGLPTYEDGIAAYKESPEDMASRVPQLISVGVNIVGGCCGTTPAHIRAISEVVHSVALR